MKYYLVGLLLFFCPFIQPQNLLFKDLPVLASHYNVLTKHSDFVIVIDRSGSMKKLWSEVTNSLSDFISALPDSDYVSVLGFSSKCDQLIIPRTITEESKQDITKELLGLSLPDGGHTDLFDAANKSLDELDMPGSNDIKFLFFITDFDNAPPENTKWNSSNLYKLNDKYNNVILNTNRLLRVYALQLSLGSTAGKDYDSFNSIFDNNVNRVLLDKNSIRDWFKRLKAEYEREKLKLVLEQNLKNGITLSSIESDRNLLIFPSKSITVALKSSLKIPVRLNNLSVSSSNYGELINSNVDMELTPGSVIKIHIPFNAALNSLDNFIDTKYPVSVSNIKVASQFELDKEFGILNLPVQKNYLLSFNRSINISEGISYLGLLLFAVILIIIFYLIWSYWIKPEWIFRKKGFRISISLNSKTLKTSPDNYLSRKKFIEIKDSILLEDNALVIPFTLLVLPQKPRLLLLKPKRGTYLACESSNQFYLNRNRRGKPEKILLGKNFRRNDVPVNLAGGISVTCDFFQNSMTNKLEIRFFSK